MVLNEIFLYFLISDLKMGEESSQKIVLRSNIKVLIEIFLYFLISDLKMGESPAETV